MKHSHWILYIEPTQQALHETSTIGNTDAACKESYWLLGYMYVLVD